MIPIGGALAGIAQSLKDFSVDPELIDEVVKTIQEGLEEIPKDIPPVSAPAFGTLSRGVELGFHTTNARDFMLTTYKELEKLLTSYTSDIKDFKTDADNIDEDAAGQLRQVTLALQSNNAERGIAGGGDS